METFHVGAFAGEDASPTRPPTDGSPVRLRAYAACDVQASSFVGGNWREARLLLRVVLPSTAAWTAGQRWFRCDLSEVGAAFDPHPVPRAGTLVSALSTPSSLRHNCYVAGLEAGQLSRMFPMSCTEPHNTEFAGVWTAPAGPYAELPDDAMLDGCLSKIADFADLPNDDDMAARSGALYFPPEEISWTAGDRGVRCFLWLEERTVSKSLKSVGVKDFPIPRD
ncbi:hypothetical protein GCM10027280_18020 [Micromonospora polyrhachis]